jgi:hypothetical protein
MRTTRSKIQIEGCGGEKKKKRFSVLRWPAVCGDVMKLKGSGGMVLHMGLDVSGLFLYPLEAHRRSYSQLAEEIQVTVVSSTEKKVTVVRTLFLRE